ncbi:hypothetical protein [uncultured Dokdonia sp.]|uniref:hypothetical protein n=1 Tax=uncultured Dokdonia sp. TaxID=575653 RepID=UPI00260BBA0A|nr:hypothetical protein [uncultured Dokdonia sp.]
MKKFQLFLVSILCSLFLNCSTDDTDSTENQMVDSSEYLYFVSGKINGESFVYGLRNDATSLDYQIISRIPLEGAVCATSQDQGLDYKVTYGSSIYPNFDNEDSQPSLGFNFVRFYRCSSEESSSQAFNSLFPTGNYEYALDDNSSGTMGQIGIDYSPIASDVSTYYESYGANDASNSFTITSTASNNDSLLGTLVNVRQIIEGTFTVRLYNVNDASDFVDITDGQFKITVSK